MIAKELAFNLIQAVAGVLVDGDSFLPAGVYQLHPHMEGGFCHLPHGKGSARNSVAFGFKEVGGVPYLTHEDNDYFTELSTMMEQFPELAGLNYLELELHLDGEIRFVVSENWSLTPDGRKALIDRLARSFDAMPDWAKTACYHGSGTPRKHPETGAPISFREAMELASNDSLLTLKDDFASNEDLLPE